MPDRPITIIAPTIQRVIDGTCTTLRRPPGALSACRPGDRLWIREQFRLPIRFDNISPLQALERDAVPVMAADLDGLPPYATADLGRPRFARELPKAWHRAHLVITAVRTERLQEISHNDAFREGFISTAQFALAWDAGQRFGNGLTLWQHDPTVLVFTFHCINAPLAGAREWTAA